MFYENEPCSHTELFGQEEVGAEIHDQGADQEAGGAQTVNTGHQSESIV